MTLPAVCATSEASRSHLRSTGKERDIESGNDYFGARYYSSAMGRFMSPDWSAKIESGPYSKLDNPQSLNLYSYVRNNPFSRVDKDCHYSAPSVGKGRVAQVCDLGAPCLDFETWIDLRLRVHNYDALRRLCNQRSFPESPPFYRQRT